TRSARYHSSQACHEKGKAKPAPPLTPQPIALVQTEVAAQHQGKRRRPQAVKCLITQVGGRPRVAKIGREYGVQAEPEQAAQNTEQAQEHRAFSVHAMASCG